MTALDSLLDTYRSETASQRDRGTAFEKLIAAWLVADPVQSKRFASVEMWSDWACRTGRDRTDVGIDLIGTLRDGAMRVVFATYQSISVIADAQAKPSQE